MQQNAFELVDDLKSARDRAGQMLLGLDFDGTLAPIVPRPGDAALPAATRIALEALVARSDTIVALVSGRGLHDLSARVGLPGAFYAGNHGLEIDGPGVHRVHEEAAAARGRLARLVEELGSRLGGVPGTIVEDKGLTVSVHFRMVADVATEREVRALVHAACAAAPEIRATDGKKVVEIRPAVDWHKGRAFAFLRSSLLGGAAAAPVVFIGDDRTDEDAFREVGDQGCSIVVGDPPPQDSVARAALRSTAEVAEFLRALAWTRHDDKH